MLTNWNIAFWEYEFYAPAWLSLLILSPALLWLLNRSFNKHKGSLKYSGLINDQRKLHNPNIRRIRYGINFGWVLVYCLLVTALAKPFHWQGNEDPDENYKNGIDIILAMDVSASMLAMDFKPNRLEVAKEVAKDFIDGRSSDRIGLVIYSGEAYTACPATLDYSIVKQQLDLIGTTRLDAGTAIGTGLGTAVTRLRSDSLSSKVIILLTDGSNNAGEIDPLTAAELARSKSIRVYTIGVGSTGEAPTPVITPFGIRYENMPVEIDEKTLQKIAQATGGKYFRAQDEIGLKTIYAEIERLEKRRMIGKQFQHDPPATPQAFLKWALLLSFLLWVIKLIYFKREA